MRAALLLTLIMLSCSAAGQSDGIVIKSGFITGIEYRAFDTNEKKKYVMGLLDGTFLAPFFDAKKNKIEWLERCATGMNDAQIIAVVDRYLSDNPARWHESMNALAFLAFKHACTN